MIRERTSKRLFFILPILALANCSCGDGHFTVAGDPQSRTRALYDAPPLQRMVSQQLQVEQRYGKELGNPNENERMAAFLFSSPGKIYRGLEEEMSRQSGFDVPGQTQFVIVLESGALPYIKVEFTSGPLKGRIGWLSRGSFDDPRTRMP